MAYNPWRDAATHLPDVHIERVDLAPCHGAWVSSERVILLDKGLDVAGRRCTLNHEIAHIDLGHGAGVGGWFGRRQERDADRLAACRMLDVDALAEGLTLHPLHPALVAQHLEVPLRLLRRMLEQLTDEQRIYIENRIAAVETAA